MAAGLTDICEVDLVSIKLPEARADQYQHTKTILGSGTTWKHRTERLEGTVAATAQVLDGNSVLVTLSEKTSSCAKAA